MMPRAARSDGVAGAPSSEAGEAAQHDGGVLVGGRSLVGRGAGRASLSVLVLAELRGRGDRRGEM
jgi:hypothetical protein